jgi:hypothetical protein
MRRSKSPPDASTSSPPIPEKLSWQGTAHDMAASREDWSAWDAAVADGLDDLLWQADRKDQARMRGE